MAFKKAGSGYGGDGVTGLAAAVKQLQGFRQDVVPGAAAATNIPVAGVTADSHILAVVNLTDNVAVAEAPTVSAGNIQFPTAVTTAKQLMVTYLA